MALASLPARVHLLLPHGVWDCCQELWREGLNLLSSVSPSVAWGQVKEASRDGRMGTHPFSCPELRVALDLASGTGLEGLFVAGW